MIAFNFQYTFKEYVEGITGASKAFRFLSLAGRVSLPILLAWGLWLYFSRNWDCFLEAMIWYFPVIAAAGVWSFFPWLLARLGWKINPNIQGVIRCEADEDEFRIWNNNSTTIHKWTAFIRFNETANLFLLFLSKQLCVLIPKRAFVDITQEAQFRELLQQKIIKQ